MCRDQFREKGSVVIMAELCIQKACVQMNYDILLRHNVQHR